MTAATRSNLLFAASLSLVTAALFGVVPAVVIAVAALLVSVGVRAPLSAVRDAAESAWDAVRGVRYSGVSLSLRWCVVLFLAGVVCGRGAQGFTLPEIRWPVIDWPTITVPSIVTPEPETPKATAATYVYEKDEHAIPGGVMSALNKINRAGSVVATLLEADPQDGTGDVPDQYKASLSAAKEAGLPCLVVTAGDAVLSVLKDPKDEQSVMEAVK